MAVDTRERRQAAAVIGTLNPVGVTPNASPDQEWRQEAGWGYPGILAGEGAVSISWSGSEIQFTIRETIPSFRVFETIPEFTVSETVPSFRVKET